MDVQTTERLIRRPEVEALTSFSTSAIYARLDVNSAYYDPAFPKPVKIGKRAIAWRESEILAWLQSRPSARAA